MKKKSHFLSPSLGKLTKLLILMKISFILLTVCTLSLSASVFPQSKKISLELKNVTIREAFDEIEKQTGFKFFYINEQVDVTRKVDLVVNDKQIEDVLNSIFASSSVKYKVFENNLVVLSPNLESAQQIRVTGKVTDAQTGESIPGVNILIQGTTIGTTTDIDGKYAIDLPNSESFLVFSYIGYVSETIKYAGQSVIDITLAPDITKLDEVVVIGYGTVKKSDLTGSVTSVTEKTIKERPVQNAIQAMQGKAAGVDIVSNVRPGEIATVTVRGNRSILATNLPLYVVDGIIWMGSLNDINANDIASVEVLKDASSTAIYGSRGANGVVLITTKKGIKGKVNVNYDVTNSYDHVNSLTDWASAGEAIDRMRLAEINGGTYLKGSTKISYPDPTADITKFGNSDYYTMEAIKKAYQYDSNGQVVMRDATEAELAKGWPAQVPVYNSSNIPTTDWIKNLTRTGITQNHLLSLSAGNDNSRLYLSFGYYDNKGTQKNQYYNRYTTVINGDINPVKWLTVGTSINAAFSRQEYGTINRSGSATGAQDAYGMALSQYVMAQPYDTLGNMILYPGNNKALPTWNPIIDIENTSDERRAINSQANLFSEISFTKWLKYRVNFGVAFRYNRNGSFQGSMSTLRRTAASPTSAANYSTSDNFQYMIENLLYVNKSFGIHTLGATLMQSFQNNRSESSFINASKIIYDSPTWYNQSANLNGMPDDYGTGYSERSLLSYMARFNYTLMNKYLLTVSGRYDGSSVLAEGHKGYFFPSFALAWKMQEENFLKPISWINELKLRFGFGMVGNSAIDPYTTMGPLLKYNYVFGSSSGDLPAIGYVPLSPPNPVLEWEKTTQTNIGLDFGILNNRISGSIEYYNSNTKDLLLRQTLPPITGFTYIISNVGKTKNRGIEITLSTVNVQTKDFKWASDITWSSNKEEIVELVNGKQDMAGNGWYIGQPIQVFRTYKVAGLWQNTHQDSVEIAKWKVNGYNFAPGQYKPVEQDSTDYKLTDKDKVFVGSTNPKWVGGLTNTFTYKNIELSIFMYARIGQKYFSSLQPGGSAGGSFVGYVRHEDPSNFWSPENTGAKWPQPTSSSLTSTADVNRATFINDGSFVIVRNISLAYSLPQRFLNKYNVKKLQVFAQIINPFMFGGEVVKAGINPDDPNGWINVNSVGDPTGGANNNTMIIRSWVMGLRVGL